MKVFHALVVVCVVAGCGVQEGVVASSDGQGETNSALKRSPVKFVTAERDLRKCFQGPCGGWFLTDANDPAALPVYVASLTFLTKELEQNADQLEGAGPGDLILQGRSTGQLAPNFEVSAAWRALPGGSARKGDLLYQLQDGGESCGGFWCRPKVVFLLNATVGTYVEGFGLELQQNVHAPWVSDRVAQGRAMALGNFGKGNSFDTFSGSRVFLQLPERRDCPQIKPPSCGAAAATKDPVKLATFTLDENRCLFFAACEEQTVCPVNVVRPSCSAGYLEREFLAAPCACPLLSCDAAWAE